MNRRRIKVRAERNARSVRLTFETSEATDGSVRSIFLAYRERSAER